MSGEDVCGPYKRGPTTVLTNHPFPITDQDSQVLHPQNREELLGGNVVPHTPPRFDKHSIEEHRLNSFKDKAWPIGLTQSPEELARAGFYYLGISDQVLCFYCEGGLQNWEPNDDPWEEHAKHFPGCGYLNLMKSTSYVKHVQQQFHKTSNKNSELERSHSSASGSSDYSGTSTETTECKTPTPSIEVEFLKQGSKAGDKAVLQQENARLREEKLCKICVDKELGVVFIPCGHFVTCRSCAASLTKCPVCRSIISSLVKTYLS